MQAARPEQLLLRPAESNLLPSDNVPWKHLSIAAVPSENGSKALIVFVQEMLVSETSSLAGMISRLKLRPLVPEHLAGRQKHQK